MLPTPYTTRSTSASKSSQTPAYRLMASLMLLFFVLLTGCASVDATVERVKSGISDRFGNNDDVESNATPVLEATVAEEPATPATKPLLVDIQEKLRTLGYYSGPISGRLDSRSEAAIQDFQLDKNLRIDGRPTAALLQKIDEALAQE